MGLFDIFKSKTSSVKTPTFQDYTTAEKQNVQNYEKNWTTYDPEKNGGFYDPTQSNKYTNAESSAINKLTAMAENGGYTDEQKNAMYNSAMTSVNNEADAMRESAKNDAYSRGLGQSSVLSRSYGDIDKSVLDQASTIKGNIESESAQMGMDAIEKIQAGEATAQQYAMEANQYKQNLMAELSMNENELQMTLNQINSAIDMDNANRELELTKIKNDFNLTTAQMEQAIALADAQNSANFWANVTGGVLNGVTTVAGASLIK